MVWQLDPESASGVMLDPSGAVTLSSSRTETYFAWIANTGDGTITKLDTRTGAQVAEYDSVLIDGVNHARPPNERCLTDEEGGNCTECFNDFGADIELTESWQKYVVLFSKMKQQEGWGRPRPRKIDRTQVFGIQFQAQAPGGAYDVWVDDIAFVGCGGEE